MKKILAGRTIPVVLAGVIGSVLLGLTTTGTFSAFTAQITNSVNNVKSGSLVLQEKSSDGSTTCLSTDGNTNNAATCATINKYGGATLLPGQSVTTTVNMKNAGTATPNTFTLTPGTCAQTGTGIAGVTPATDLCSKITVKVYAAATATGVPIISGTASAIGGTATTLTNLAAGASQDYTFVVSLDSSAGNTYQNLTATQPLVWAMS